MADSSGADTQREVLSRVTARLRDACVRKPCVVDGGLDPVSVCRELSVQGLTNALVRHAHGRQERLGIFTATDLREALAIGKHLDTLSRQRFRLDIL